MTGIGQALFPCRANGSLVRAVRGEVIGSPVLGQGFAGDRAFQTRPSAAGKGYYGFADRIAQPLLGLIGAERVNVLALNVAPDRLEPAH